MISLRRGSSACAALALALPVSAFAHGFGRLYNLPVPLWLYAWGASAALVVSFLLAAFFASVPPRVPKEPQRVSGTGLRPGGLTRVVAVLRGVSVAALLLAIATGLFGNRDPMRNFSMTAFWIVFVLGLPYFTALAGNVYAAVNPWRVIVAAIDRNVRDFARGRFRYPQRLGDWPALALYLALIWFELFGSGRPFGLGVVLLGYSLLTLVGVWLVGANAWFRHCELFSVFLQLTARMAPLAWHRATAGGAITLQLRAPFSGLVQERPEHLSTVAFALAMLSTTAFDGLRETQWWVGLVWRDPTGIVTALFGKLPILALAEVRPWYVAWESFWLVASPFVYLAAYLAALLLARWLNRSARPLRELALDFGYTLLPIALVYNVTHYATLILSQGMKIVSLLSDPFGWGWNIFGTANLLRAPILPPMGLVWHSQVALILFGHIVSVYVAHRVALRIFPTRAQALLSQVPMLALMVAFTVAGLWILAQPLTAMLMR